MTIVAGVKTNHVSYTDFHVGLPVRVLQAVALLREHPIETVLDIGCADGAFLSQFPTCMRVGVDLASNRFRPADIRFVQADVASQYLPFADSYFDAIYAGEIIEHIFDTERFLREINRILKPRGVLVLTTPNLCSLKNLYCWVRGRQLAWIDYNNRQYGHVRYFSPQSIQILLRETGYTVTRICSSGFEIGAHAPWLDWMTPLTQWIFAHNVRGNCLIVAAINQSLS
jgi:SAM-dependent methyltransferase